MIRLKTRWFNKWAKKNLISDAVLLKALDALINDLNVVNLGGGLYKIRTPGIGRGKSGSFRTLVVYKEMDKAIFIYGFSKAERDNLDDDELKKFKTLAKDLLQISSTEYARQVALENFFKLE